MSTLRAEVVRVVVEPHPNADRLDLVKVKGWQCVSAKGQFKTGDLAIYLPVDSVLPAPLVSELGIEKMYSKRLRTIKLRGYISQGVVMKYSLPPFDGTMMNPLCEGDDVTNMLGITKYEVPIPVSMAGKQLPDDPRFQKYTDIENIKNYPDAMVPGELVIVTEKIHAWYQRPSSQD